jgi:hypothetical protein
VDAIMQQAKEVQEAISAMFSSPRFFVWNKTKNLGRMPVLLEYDSPKRPKAKAEGCPSDWAYRVRALTRIATPRAMIETESVCNPVDEPDRGLGRAIALMRMAEVVVPLGWEVVVTSKNGDVMVIPPLKESG